MNRNYNAPLVNPLPPVVWWLVIPIAGIELVLSLADAGLAGGREGIGWRAQAVALTAFSGDLWDRMFAIGAFDLRELLRLVTYPLVHVEATHTLFAVVFTLALGKFVGEVYRAWAVLVVFFGASAFGAAVYGTLLNDRALLIGAYPGAYGLIGAFTFILWTRLGAAGEDQRRAFVFIGFLMLFQICFNAVNIIFYGRTGNFWLPELAGFAAGFGLSFVVSPGGWQRVLAKMRQG